VAGAHGVAEARKLVVHDRGDAEVSALLLGLGRATIGSRLTLYDALSIPRAGRVMMGGLARVSSPFFRLPVMNRSLAAHCALLVFFALSSPILAAPPTISSVTPRGLEIDGTTTLTIKGQNLGGDLRLIGTRQIAGQKVLSASDAQIELSFPTKPNPASPVSGPSDRAGLRRRWLSPWIDCPSVRWPPRLRRFRSP